MTGEARTQYGFTPTAFFPTNSSIGFCYDWESDETGSLFCPSSPKLTTCWRADHG
jgi:hypothetical protein